LSPERTPDMFDAWAEEYDYYLDVGKNNFPLIGYNRVLDRIVELAEPEPHHKILDVGIGTGNLAQRFVKYDCEIWGIDFSSKMLEEAAKKLPNIRLLRADVQSDWPSELKVGFNRIVSAYTIHHLKLAEKVDAIERMSRDLLEPSGSIIIGDVSFQTIKARDIARKKLGSEWDDDEFYWAADEILDSMMEKGFNVMYEQISEYAGIYKIRR
jgi:putative AdoMet-dependent methyltransferase